MELYLNLHSAVWLTPGQNSAFLFPAWSKAGYRYGDVYGLNWGIEGTGGRGQAIISIYVLIDYGVYDM